MGSFYELSVASFVVEQGKNHLSEHAVVPFQMRDLVTPPPCGEGEEAPYVYSTTGRTVARRLDLLGYTVGRARREFAEGYEHLEDWQVDDVPEDFTCSDGFETWRALMSTAVAAASRGAHLVADEQADERLRYILGHGNHYLGFAGGHPLSVLRAVVDLAEDDAPVTLDLTDLIAGGWIREEYLQDGEEKQPLIVVTEGKSDSRLLRRALEVLVPEFERYISFIDFETANAKGGTDELVQFVRMFIGCGIRNRIVVLFDNDTAGHEALQRVRDLSVPANVFAMTLPESEPARAYPTLGPDGAGVADINGRACSLELYLGEDTLAGADGRPFPIRWTGFNEKLQRYQGQVAQKGVVQERFDKKLTEWARRPGASPASTFSGVLAIFDAIFGAVAER